MSNIMNLLKRNRVYVTFCLVLGFVIILLYCYYREANVGLDYPNLSDYKEISVKQFKNLLKDNKLSDVYMSDKSVYVYADHSDENRVLVHNPKTDDFDESLYDSDVIVHEVTSLVTREDYVSKAKAQDGMLLFAYAGLSLFILLKIWEISIYRQKETVEADYDYTDKRSKKTDKAGHRNTKTFADIAGLQEVKKDMQSLVDFLVNKEKYTDMGAKLPKGVILYGPPGTGKTLLAKAVANEADVPFFYMSGSEFVEKYVGVGAKRVRELFEKARKAAPCIVFIDEIDTIGSQRSGEQHSEDRKTINALLTEMDGFKESENIIVIGATNRLEDLDDALTRPGRFTDKFCVSLPETSKERREVIDMYVKNKKLGDDIDLDALSKELVGFSPAKIEALLNESAIIAVQSGQSYINKRSLDKAMYKLLLNGHEKEDQSERDISELEIVAWHEAGHALIGKLNGKDVTKVTILSSTSGAGGVTFSTPKKQSLHSVIDLKQEVMELYGGRLAELIYFDGDRSKVTTGASNDIERATNIINNMVSKYAMSDDFGLLNIEKLNISKESIVKQKVKLAKEIESEAYQLLEQNLDKLRNIASSLIQNETISGEELDTILSAA